MTTARTTITRRLSFDAAHRITRHESKCRNLHGHRYDVVIAASAAALDDLGRVVDFGVIKERVGGWIDTHLDHGALVAGADTIRLGINLPRAGAPRVVAPALGDVETAVPLADVLRWQGWKVYKLAAEPTAEVIAAELLRVAQELLADTGVRVDAVEVYETPNCTAKVTA